MISRNRRVVLTFVLSVAAVGCDKLPLLAPTASTITLFAGSNTVQANGSMSITATVLESSGTPVQNGTLVSFTTTVGQLSPSEARTQNGQVSVTFSGNGQSGEAQIQAISGGAKLTAPLTIKVGGAAASRIQLTANPGTVPSNGGSSQVTATVTDANGNTLASIPVTFSTDAGTLSSAIVMTDANGQATTTLTTNREAKVTATAGGTSTGTSTSAASGTVIVKVNVLPGLTITVPATVVAGVPATFTVAVTGTGASNFRDVTIFFGDGSSQSLGTSGGSIQHVYSADGSYQLTVRGIDITGEIATQATTVVVQPRPQLVVTISATTANPVPAAPTTFTITATPSTGSSIQSINVDFGDGSSLALQGSASSVQHVYSAAGTYTVTAKATDTSGTMGSASTVIVVGGGTVASFTISPSPAKVGQVVSFNGSDSTSSSPITAYTYDFGDGTSASGSSPTQTHIYGAVTVATAYTVRLTIQDSAGRTATTTKALTVNP